MQLAEATMDVPAETAPDEERGALSSLPSWAWVTPAAFVALLAIDRIGPNARGVLAVFFVGVLMKLAYVDLRTHKLPNRIVLPAAGATLVAHIAIVPSQAATWVLAGLAASLFLLLPLLVAPTGMGMGDVKLALLLGAGLGWNVFPALMIGFVSFIPFAALLFLRHGAEARRQVVPFGPFLVFGALVVTLVAGPSGAI